MSAEPQITQRLVAVGERFGKTLCLSRDDIAHFARQSCDDNPLHHDLQAVQRAGYADLIASGQHTAAIMMGLVATHFSRCHDGVVRDMLCLNFNFAFKHPVLAGQELVLSWQVATVQWNNKLGGMLAKVDGTAATPQASAAVIGRGTVLVRRVGRVPSDSAELLKEGT